MSNKNALQGANVRTLCISLRTPATNKHSQHTEKPALSLRLGMRRTFFRRDVLYLYTGRSDITHQRSDIVD